MTNHELLEFIELAALEERTEIHLSSKSLTVLPASIGKLTKATHLYLSGNQFRSLPTELAKLKSLRSLDLSDNLLTSLPPTITKLTSLERLNLDNNKLETFPLEITLLSNLMELYITQNGFGKLPSQIGNLTKLTELYVCGNQLRNLPTEVSKLKSLRSLDLSGNQLTSLPPAITKLKNLERLNLQNNQSLPVLEEVLADPFDIQKIFNFISGELVPFNEAKMLVIGDGKVGKTSVVKRLLNLGFNELQETTAGVEIDELEIKELRIDAQGSPVKLNIWDFGGQEIQHHTHQFFLTTRCLYLLVLDARRHDTYNSIQYWLNLIRNFGGAAPIIIVINQVDQLKGQPVFNIDRKTMTGKYNIKAFVEMSCKDDKLGDGSRKLREAIATEVEGIPHTRATFPKKFLKVKQRLKELTVPYIAYEQYIEICREAEISDELSHKNLLEVLHELGIVVSFEGDPNVLNPHWVTRGVYSLLTSQKLTQNKGRLKLTEIAEILESQERTRSQYPQHTHRKIIEMMKRFELCFEFNGREGHYLLPGHLDATALDIPWDDTESLLFEYQYKTMPPAIISRFIVRSNTLIENQYYWRNGVFLNNKNNRARISAEIEGNQGKIRISVIGREEFRREFLGEIRQTLQEINRSYKELGIEEKVPVPDSPDILIPYNHLVLAERQGETRYFVPEIGQSIAIKKLLGLVEVQVIRNNEENSHFASHKSMAKQNSPWLSGSFYLFTYVIGIATAVGAVIILSKYGVSMKAMTILPLVILAGLLGSTFIGALQLRNDRRLKNKSFVNLMIEALKRFPLLRYGNKPGELTGDEKNDVLE